MAPEDMYQVFRWGKPEGFPSEPDQWLYHSREYTEQEALDVGRDLLPDPVKIQDASGKTWALHRNADGRECYCEVDSTFVPPGPKRLNPKIRSGFIQLSIEKGDESGLAWIDARQIHMVRARGAGLCTEIRYADTFSALVHEREDEVLALIAEARGEA